MEGNSAKMTKTILKLDVIHIICYNIYMIVCLWLRRGEALALTVRDIDFSHKIIHVHNSLFFKENEAASKCPKTA